MTGKVSIHNKCDVNTLNNSENTVLANNLKILTKSVLLPETKETMQSTEFPKLIYVNPNYGVKKHLIHVNPNVHTKTSIHINPKLNPKSTIIVSPKMGTKTSIYVNPKINPKASIAVSSKMDTKTSIYVNPKIVKDINIVKNLQGKESSIDKNSTESTGPNTLQGYVQKSVHVNPKLLKTFTSSQATKSLPSTTKTTEQINYNVYSKSNIKNVGSNKFVNTNFSVISRRNLIRVKRNFKSSTLIVSPIKNRQFGNKVLKKTQISEHILSPSPSRSVQINNRLKFVKNKTKVSAYKLERVAVSKGKNKNSGFASTKISSNFKKLVSIEGIRYNSSKNQLVRRNSTSPVKKKRIVSCKTQDQFFIASNGKALRRIDTTKKGHSQMTPNRFVSGLNRTLIKRTSPVSLKQTIKSNISNKVKQRSIQLLRNKMRKNNQPCLFFKKFGYCANQTKGTCHKVHDKKQIALCRNFLQGKCLLENCKLSHDVGPEKMPTCKYFLEGCCSRDECPYLHVKVSEKTPICRQFLQGYCAKGNECKERHIYVCPEFEKEGTCSKGKQCPYPHKSKTQKVPRTLRVNKDLSTLKASDSNDLTCNTIESRKRYYDNSNEDLEEKRERILQQLKIIKATQPNQDERNKDIENINEETPSRVEIDSSLECVPRKRPPVGILPSYIPIN